jgi:hypothetical protein
MMLRTLQVNASRAIQASVRSLPKNSVGDKLFALISFARNHRRLPGRKPLINDVLFLMKTSPEIMRPERAFVSDKEFLKIFVSGTIGDRYNVPTLAILRNAEEVDAFDFPESCCIKPTHASGLVCFRRAGEAIDKAEIKRWLTINYYDTDREPNYKRLQPKIIVEPLVWGIPDPIDYKLFCYRGKVRLVQVHLGRFSEHRSCFYDRDWNLQDYSLCYPRHPAGTERPQNFSEMIEVAEMLGAHFNLIRVDLYSNGSQILVGELTNCVAAGNGNFYPRHGEVLASQTLFAADQLERI